MIPLETYSGNNFATIFTKKSIVARYKKLLSLTRDSIIYTNQKGLISDVNDSFLELYGFEDDQRVIGKALSKFITTVSQKPIDDIISELPTSDKIVCDCKILFNDGSTMSGQFEAAFINNDKGEENELIFLLRKETENCRHSKGLHNDEGADIEGIEEVFGIYEDKFSKAFRINPDVIGYSILEDGTYLDVSDSFEKVFGYSKEEVIGKSSVELNLWFDSSTRGNLVEELERTGEINNAEIKLRHKSGKAITTLMSARIIEIKGKKRVLTTVRNISEKKEIEKALIRSEERFRSIAQISPVGIFENDLNGNCIYVNDRVLELTKLESCEILNGKWVDSIHENDRERVMKSWAETVKTGRPFVEEYRFMDSNNSLISWVLGQAIAKKNINGVITGFMGTLTDITESKGTQEAIRESEERFRAIFEQAAVGICQASLEGNFIKVNQKLCDILGYGSGELLQLNFRDVSHPDDLELDIENVNKMLNNKINTFSMEKRYYRKTGEIVWCVLSVSLVRDLNNKPKYFVGVIKNINEKKEAEEKLKQREKEYRSIFENQMYGISIAYSDLKFSRVNPAFCKLLEYDEDELISHVTFKNLTHPDDIQESAVMMRKLLKREIEKFHVEKRYITKSGKIISASTFLQATYDDDGNFVNCTATLMDITAKKEAEVALKSSLHEKEVLLKEIHHRVKNNLQIISSLLHLQSKHADKNIQSILHEGINRVRAMALIHEKLYGSKGLDKVNFGEYAKDLVNFLVHTYNFDEPGIRMNFEADDICLDVDTAIPTGLILNELISNSLKHAFPDKNSGDISVSIKKNNEVIEILVTDNGVGIKTEVNVNEAKTLGLKLVHTLVDQLEGTVKFEMNEGTRVTINFQHRIKD